MTDVEKLLKQLRRHVMTLEGLIVSKKATGRPKDLKLVPELEALLEIRKSQGS